MGVTSTGIVAGNGFAAEAIANRLKEDGVHVMRLFSGGNAFDPPAIVRQTAEAIKALDDFDLLVTSYARHDAGNFLTADETKWRMHVDAEVSVPFFVAQAAARAMTEKGRPGAIIHVIERADPQTLSSAVTENACRLMIAGTALDLIPSRIRVCGINGAAVPSLDEAYCETIAAAVSFCASSGASYVVASTFDPYGNREARWP